MMKIDEWEDEDDDEWEDEDDEDEDDEDEDEDDWDPYDQQTYDGWLELGFQVMRGETCHWVDDEALFYFYQTVAIDSEEEEGWYG